METCEVWFMFLSPEVHQLRTKLSANLSEQKIGVNCGHWPPPNRPDGSPIRSGGTWCCGVLKVKDKSEAKPKVFCSDAFIDRTIDYLINFIS